MTEPRHPESPVSQAAARAGLAGARVLVVDDEPFNREIAYELLEQAGAEVTLADGGDAALECIARQCFDCVLMDTRMPAMDGLETTRRIRGEAAAAAGVPIVAMTANAAAADREACFAAGMDGFIAKPFAPEQLYAVLARVLARGAPSGGERTAFEPALDYALLARTVKYDAAKVAKFARVFVDNLRGGVADAEAALAREDAAALRFLGHRLKPSALTVGALEIAELCEALEHARAEDDPLRARNLVRRLHELTDEIAALIEKHEKMAAA